MVEGSSTSPIDRRLAAVVVVDVVGYSRMMGADESETLRALVDTRETIVEPLVRECKGGSSSFWETACSSNLQALCTRSTVQCEFNGR